jgi:hypothetical protein
MYSHLNRYKKKRKVPRKSLLLTMFVMTVLAVLLIKILVAFPVVQATTDIRNATIANNVAIPWPAYGQSAVGVKGYGVIGMVDFSILLYYWKQAAPKANPYVDLNNDGVVNTADFSIMLAQWGTTGKAL